MKTLTIKKLIASVIICSLSLSFAYAQKRKSIAIVTIDTKDLVYDNSTVTDMVRLELEKTDSFELLDKYDIRDMMATLEIDVNTCYGKTKLINVGKQLDVDMVLTGSVERLGEKIIFILRLIDVEKGIFEKTDVMEYLNQQEQLQIMARISVNNMLNIANDPYLVDLLVNFDQPITSLKTTLELNGPRMGAFLTTGDNAERMSAPLSEGGFNMFPYSSMFGYQWEVQYLSSGDFQALIEFVGAINSLESGTLIPSITFLNGFRFNKSGIEFGAGPVLRGVKMAKGYYDNENVWHLAEDLTPGTNTQLIELLDSRGKLTLSTGLIIAAGKTIRSGYLNMPINVYVSPSKKGTVYGVTFGFNVAKRPKL